jgi:hypothetical protein
MSMKTTLSLLFIAITVIAQNVKAQRTYEDSTEVVNAARRYSLSFRLSNKDLKKFQAEHFPATSDYFKQIARKTPDVLLNDSLFVKTYRVFAFNNVLDQRSFPSLRDLLPPTNARPGPSETIYSDPVKQTAKIDAKRFSLSKPMLHRFKTGHFPETSDYFKPGASNASNPALLSDSAYVQTFRFEAYRKSHRQPAHPVGRAFFIGGIAAVSAALLLTLVVALARVHYY